MKFGPKSQSMTKHHMFKAKKNYQSREFYTNTVSDVADINGLFTYYVSQKSDMQFFTNFTRITFQNICLPKNHLNYDKLRFLTKQRELNFHIKKNIHTQGYITLISI